MQGIDHDIENTLFQYQLWVRRQRKCRSHSKKSVVDKLCGCWGLFKCLPSAVRIQPLYVGKVRCKEFAAGTPIITKLEQRW
jgi:hypothetical protein